MDTKNRFDMERFPFVLWIVENSTEKIYFMAKEGVGRIFNLKGTKTSGAREENQAISEAKRGSVQGYV